MSEANPARLQCGKCGCHHFEVANTMTRGGEIRRRRLCRHCGRPLQTREIPESLYKQLMAPKQN